MFPIIPAAIVASLLIGGCAAQKEKKESPAEEKIDRKRNDGQKITASDDNIYNGAFLQDGKPTLKSVIKYEKSTREPLDFVVFFHAFALGFAFPRDICEMLYKHHKTAAFIKLEPWTWRGGEDITYSLDKINSGLFDDGIEYFAQGAAKWRKPVFIAFGHEMNGTWYPWAGNPGNYVLAFKRIVDIFNKTGATNVTWVWNIDARFDFKDYYPGDKYVDFIAVDNYGSSHDTVSQLFDNIITALRTIYKKPVIIGETSYDGNTRNGGSQAYKQRYVKDLPKYCKNKKISGFVWFNLDKVEEGRFKQWSLGWRYRNALKDSINSIQTCFDKGIKTQSDG
ncbi:MAG: glycosyl hydrolase [Candidatus Margulisiibacteriota bacterium]